MTTAFTVVEPTSMPITSFSGVLRRVIARFLSSPGPPDLRGSAATELTCQFVVIIGTLGRWQAKPSVRREIGSNMGFVAETHLWREQFRPVPRSLTRVSVQMTQVSVAQILRARLGFAASFPQVGL